MYTNINQFTFPKPNHSKSIFVDQIHVNRCCCPKFLFQPKLLVLFWHWIWKVTNFNYECIRHNDSIAWSWSKWMLTYHVCNLFLSSNFTYPLVHRLHVACAINY